MTTSWDEVRLTCIHGILEGLDSHDCPKCYEIAKKRNLDVSNGKTYIFVYDIGGSDGTAKNNIHENEG